ncbi:MAG: sensor histidine kinase [Anaerolineales bacterium]|nr:sensor histidine kinase [Anaerolineales bacterium]
MDNPERSFFIDEWVGEKRKLLAFISSLKLSIRQRIYFSFLIVIFLMSALNVVFGLQTLHYQHSYDAIMRNITTANSLNGYVSSEINREMWRIITGYLTFDEGIQYDILDNTSSQLTEMMQNAASRRGELKLDVILRTLNSLEKSIDEMGALVNSGADTETLRQELEEVMWVAGLIEANIQDYMVFEVVQSEQQYMQIRESFRQWLWINGIVLAAVLIFSSLAAWVISESIYSPIKKLHDVTATISNEDLDVLLRGEYHDEITKLSLTFNSMVNRINALLESKVEEQKNLKKAELRTLQAQITPHFLYNTLDTLIWLAEGGQNEDVVEIVKALSDFFRIGLSKGEDWITLREEIQHTRSYLTIQQMRYSDILDFEIRINPEILDSTVLKLTLQPLVENAIYHGIKKSRGGGKIIVSGEKLDNQTMRLSVIDTGAGFPPERLAQIRSEIENFSQEVRIKESGFGLENVNKRIRLYYGEGYRLQIDSTYMERTCVSITVPILHQAVGKQAAKLTESAS